MERLACLSIVAIFAVVRIPFHPADSSFGLLSCCELDDVGYEEMTGHESIEHGSEKQVLASIVMAAYADQNSVLSNSQRGPGMT